MNLVDDLIRRARANPPPAELTINENEVSALAEHGRSCMKKPPLRGELEEMIRQGKMRFMAIPLRVLGAKPGDSGADAGSAP